MATMPYTPLVSIITPTFNHRDYIEACLRSVDLQEYTNWEQIIVDDGSGDSTAEMVERHCSERRLLLRRRHRGIAALGESYNEALGHARGDLIAILEGDDLWPQGKLLRQVKDFEDTRVVLSWGDGLIVDSSGHSMGRVGAFRKIRGRVVLGMTDIMPRLLLVNFIFPSSGIIVRKEALDGIGGFIQPEGVPYVDLPTWLALATRLKLDERFVCLDDVVVGWRFHPGQFSQRYEEMVSSRARLISTFLNTIRDQGHDPPYASRGQLRAVEEFSHARAEFARGQWPE